MHALGEPHILPDRRVVRIADYHPHRVARALTADQGVDGGGDDEPGPGPGEEGARRGRPDQDQDQGQSMRGQIPYIEKDIPLPDGVLRRPESGVKCMLGEDVVVLLEVGSSKTPHSLPFPSTRKPRCETQHCLRGNGATDGRTGSGPIASYSFLAVTPCILLAG